MDREKPLQAALNQLRELRSRGVLLRIGDLESIRHLGILTQHPVLFLHYNAGAPETQKSIPNLSMELRDDGLAPISNKAMIEERLNSSFGICELAEIARSPYLCFRSLHYAALSSDSLVTAQPA
jgi:hypothetical protein